MLNLSNVLRHGLIVIFLLFAFESFAQEKQRDSVHHLEEVQVIYRFSSPDFSRSTASEGYISQTQLLTHGTSAFVSAVNSVSGVRMEERSPGSYRLSLRGSLLRSPFGIRNVKIYIDEFPLTDAGGNTYLNLIDVNSVTAISILKGPQASIFGANTGGAVLLNTHPTAQNQTEIAVLGGSYETIHQNVRLARSFGKVRFAVSEGYQKSSGYRENSALERKYLQATLGWSYSEKGTLRILGFYSDLDYQTPGGLTESQVSANARAARPATPTLPGAITQKAAIYNQTAFGGISQTYQFNANLKLVTALYGSHTDFENPFITNYEKRKERTLGLRAFMNYNLSDDDTKYDIYLGMEGARTATKIDNYGNAEGSPSALMASDDLLARQDFAFLRANIDLHGRWLVELGGSLNFFGYRYESYFPLVVAEQRRSFRAQLMPKAGISYRVDSSITLRSSVAKGYSPPTIAEVRASDNMINTNLQAEGGWNYEMGIYYRSSNRRFLLDGSAFYFHLKNAIVRRLTANDAEYFLNAGGTKQLGAEIQGSYVFLKTGSQRFLDGLKLNSSFTYSHFRFEDFYNANQDFSGNRLTGVPKYTVVHSLDFTFTKGLFLFLQHNYTSALPLNDANSFYAKSYHLADLKLGLRSLSWGKSQIDLSLGINNLLNEDYSLGNDLNAVGNRFFNPAPLRNYSVRIGLRF